MLVAIATGTKHIFDGQCVKVRPVDLVTVQPETADLPDCRVNHTQPPLSLSAGFLRLIPLSPNTRRFDS